VIEIERELAAITREVGTRTLADGDGIAVVLRRRYAAPPATVWEALTDPDTVRRWFFPLSGDLREGGTFQFAGNAGGEIRHCDPPHRLTVTWGSEVSIVTVRLSPPAEGATALELEHTVPLALAGSGVGAFFVGPGWDGALLALGLYLAGQVAADPVAAAQSPEARAFTKGSVEAWAAAIAASETATAEELAGARVGALAQWAPE
jgi:uncharacterized protein YndB with AHSA1/START domain